MQKNFFSSLSYFLLFCTSAVLLVLLGYVTYLAAVCPLIEWREMANVTVIQSIRESQVNNITALPENIYLYGLLQGTLLSWLPECLNPVLTNRFLALLCLMLSGGVLLCAVNRALALGGKAPLRPFSAFIVYAGALLPHLFDLPSSLGTPNYTGLLLNNLILLFALHPRKLNIILFTLLAMGCFMTKAYYLFSLVYIAASYLFLVRGKRKWAEAVAGGLLLCCGTGLILCGEQARYMLIHHLLQGAASKDATRLIDRSACYLLTESGLLWLMLFFCKAKAGAIRHQLRACCFRGFIKKAAAYIKGERISVILFILSANAAALTVMVRMGQHTGAFGILYYAQLLTPPLVLLCGYAIGCRPPQPKEYCGAFLLTIMSCVLIIFGKAAKSYGHLCIDTAPVIQDFSDKTLHVRGSVLTAPVEWELCRNVTDNGLLEYAELIYRSQEKSDIRTVVESYKKQLVHDIEQTRYDVIYTDLISYLNEHRFPELKQHYKATDLSTKGNGFTRWVPKNK